jgi:uncharacterized repeat protein (TIGR01451 family)
MKVRLATLHAAGSAALLLLPLAVLAQQPGAGALSLKTVVEKVVETKDADGATKTELVPAASAVPGDQVVYTVTFKNVSTQAADNIRITNPIPAEMQYVADTASGPGSDVLYSVDGGKTYGRAGELYVTDADGTRRQAGPADYTHSRGVLKSPLAAGAQGFARFRATVR